MPFRGLGIGVQLLPLVLVRCASFPRYASGGLVLDILIVDGMPGLVFEFLVQRATLYQDLDLRLGWEAIRPFETTEKQRRRTRARNRERRKGQNRDTWKLAKNWRKKDLASGEREKSSRRRDLLASHGSGYGGFLYILSPM